MKKNPYILNVLLTAVLFAVLAFVMVGKVLFPAVNFPQLNIPNMVLLSLAALLLSAFWGAKEVECWGCTAVLAVLSFTLLPLMAGLTCWHTCWKTGLIGGGAAVYLRASAVDFRWGRQGSSACDRLCHLPGCTGVHCHLAVKNNHQRGCLTKSGAAPAFFVPASEMKIVYTLFLDKKGKIADDVAYAAWLRNRKIRIVGIWNGLFTSLPGLGPAL